LSRNSAPDLYKQTLKEDGVQIWSATLAGLVPPARSATAKGRLDEEAVQWPKFMHLRPALSLGWDHWTARLVSFGTDGWFRSESMAAIVGMRSHAMAIEPNNADIRHALGLLPVRQHD
jgi:hypothetical protein